MCLNLCHSLVSISFQSVDMCWSAWRPCVSLSSSSHRPTLLLSNLSSSLSPASPSHPHSLQLFFFSFSSFTLSPSSLSLSLENPNKPFSHSLSLSDDLLRYHRLPRDCLSADSLSGHARLHANAIGVFVKIYSIYSRATMSRTVPCSPSWRGFSNQDYYQYSEEFKRKFILLQFYLASMASTSRRVTLSYVIEENTFWMRIYPPLQPVKTEFPPEATLKRKHQKEILVNSDDQDEPNSNRCKRPKGNKQAVYLKSPPPCQKQKILKSTPKELSKQRHPNLKIRASKKKKDLKSTLKKSNKQHQYKHSRRPAIVKLNPDGSYGWEKIVTRADAADARPQVMHFPKQFSRLFLGKKQNKVLVQAEAGDTFSCKIMTATRNRDEKYISNEWTKFVRRNNLQVGDKLIFTLQNQPTKLLIQIIRCSVHN
ncbi:B3 domain-containing protein REM16 [Trifolium repens]|nr:B3 domain-containing protein REM16 [Trifolium repens]